MPPPAAAAELFAIPVTDSSGDIVRLGWDNVPDTEGGYRIERSSDGGQSYSAIGSVPTDETGYVDTTAQDGIEYTYRVFAFNDGGDSASSNTASAGFPATPTSLTATLNQQAETVKLTWSDQNPTLASEFEIQWSSDGTNFFTIDEIPATPTGGNYEYTDENPAPAKDNYYQIVAESPAVTSDSDDLESDPSNVADAQVVAAPIAVNDVDGTVNDDGTLAPYTTTDGQPLFVSAVNGVLANDIDPQGQPLQVVLNSTTQPQHGSVDLEADGSFTYFPDAGFSGTDTFTYIATNGTLNSDPATVAITVADQPVMTQADYYSVTGGILSVPAGALGANDSNPDNAQVTYSVANGATPQHGTLWLNSNGSFTYIPNNGFTGLDSFQYLVTQDGQQSNASPVVIAVNASYTPPVANTEVPTRAQIQTFPNNLKGLWNSYMASKNRLGNVASALAAFGAAAQAVQNSDPTTSAGPAAVDNAIAKLDLLYAAYDAYVRQSAATVNASGNYMKSIRLFTSPWDADVLQPNPLWLQAQKAAAANPSAAVAQPTAVAKPPSTQPTGKRDVEAYEDKKLRDRMGKPPQNMKNPQAHHDLPQAKEFKPQWDRVGLDINDPQYGRWVEGTPPGTHQNWSNEFNQEWRNFFAGNETATRDEILDEMNRLRNDPRFQ